MKHVQRSIFLIAFLATSGFCQTGTVASYAKISHTQGTLGSSLVNQSLFGYVGETATEGVLFSGAPFEGNGALYLVTLTPDGESAGSTRLAPQALDFFGSETAARFGTAALDIGDQNADGSADYLIGAPGVQPFGALVYALSNGGDYTYSLVDLPPSFQEPAATIGSFLTFDGSNILVSSSAGAGRIFRCSLSSDGAMQVIAVIDQTHPLLISKLEVGDNFGTGISTADMNGDGITDILCGATGDDDQGSNFGAVYVLLNNATGEIESVRKYSRFEGDFGGFLNSDDGFGISVRAIGDLDQNGVVDLVVGAPGDDDGGLDIGSIWILFMREDGTVRDERKINRLAGNFAGDINFQDRFGSRIATLGDHNGDGTIDLAVGSVEDDDGGQNRGAFFTLFIEHCPAPSGQFDWSIEGTTVHFSAEGGPTYSHIWNFDDGGYSQAQNPSHTYASNGTYWVCLAINSDCGGDNFCQNVQITTLSLNEQWIREIKLYPNPSSDLVDISWPSGVQLLRFLDITGKEVYRFRTQGLSHRFETTMFPVGLYLVEFSSDERTVVKKWNKIN